MNPRWVAALTALALLAACQRGPDAQPAPVRVSPAPPPAVTPTIPAAPPVSDRVDADPTKSFACGSERCRAGAESCCSNGEAGACVANAPADPPGSPQLLASQIEKCRGSAQPDIDRIARCGSSAHCAPAERCCEEALFGGALALICKPSSTPATCSYGEACTADLPCRDTSMRCAKGNCRKQSVLQCGSKSCDLTTHTCHATDARFGKLECVADAQVTAMRAEGRPIQDVECLRHADCNSGELCLSALGRTFCQRSNDGNTATVCASAADCPKDFCAAAGQPKAKIVCARDPTFWHSICGCK